MILPSPPLSKTYDSVRRWPRVAGLALVPVLMMGLPAAAASLGDTGRPGAVLPQSARRIVPTGPQAQILIHALAPDRLVGLVAPFDADAAIYVDREILARPQVPMASRTAGPDLAAIARLKPDLLIDYGAPDDRSAQTDVAAARRLGSDATLLDGRLTEAAAVLKRLGPPLQAVDRAAVLADRLAALLDATRPLATLPDAQRVPVYLARGADGLTAARAGTLFDEPVRLAGGRNVVPAGQDAFRRMTVDEVLALHPKVVIFEDREALRGPLGRALPADVAVLLDNGVPYKVLTGAPSLNRFIGLAALAAFLHPRTFAMDPEDVARVETLLFPIPPGLAVPAPLARLR